MYRNSITRDTSVTYTYFVFRLIEVRAMLMTGHHRTLYEVDISDDPGSPASHLSPRRWEARVQSIRVEAKRQKRQKGATLGCGRRGAPVTLMNFVDGSRMCGGSEKGGGKMREAVKDRRSHEKGRAKGRAAIGRSRIHRPCRHGGAT
ncbi:uncharacterized protein LOC125500657 [Athalia rosae]|uniref:uncharacterized protein LOC125500657 n=1 Tax=Athalia rosae TaxID=37344 RepID=UPI002033256B|nr:uncharacterized protein LOC125500657 [Athalia rosae]